MLFVLEIMLNLYKIEGGLTMIDLGTAGAITGTLFTGKELLQTVYSDLAQPSVRKVGKALCQVLEYGGTYLTFIGDKQKLLLNKRLKEYEETLNMIPESKIVDVPPEIGVPVFQRLSYTTNDDIANMFIQLLTKASSSETIHLAQPRFINIIENLSEDEARLINYLKGREDIPYFYVKATDGISELMLLDKITALDNKIKFVFRENVSAYLDNLESLGIINDKWNSMLFDQTVYEEIEALFGNEEYFTDKNKGDPNPKGGGKEWFINFCKDNPKAEGKRIIFPRSYYSITIFGKKFINCCTKPQDSHTI